MVKEVTRHSNPQVLVIGDLAYENVLIPDTAAQKNKANKHSDYAGATIIRDIIQGAVRPQGRTSRAADVYPRGKPGPDRLKKQLRELVAIFGKLPKRSQGNKSDVVWRVGSTHRMPPQSDKFEAYDTYLDRTVQTCPKPDLIVIYEDDKQFRLAFKRLESKLKRRNRGANRKKSKPTLILALSDEVTETSIKTARNVFGTGATIAIVTADGLRRKGMDIAPHSSLEQTVHDVSKSLRSAPLKEILALCSHVVVLLEDSGILCLTKRGSEGTIHFTPNFDRVAQTHPLQYGRVPGRMAIVLGATARRVCLAGTQADIPSLDLAPALRLSVAAYDRMYENGFDEKDPFKTARNVLTALEREELRNILTSEPPQKRRPFLISSLNFKTDKLSLEGWSRLDALDGPEIWADPKIPDIGTAIVTLGVEQASRRKKEEDKSSLDEWWPQAEIACPFMQVGKLQTFDKDEIQRLASLAKLITKYHDDPKWLTPLSIAVFGPPGAGKSFAVKQLIKTVNPSIKESSILTFNLAQFNSLELLTEAFHQVQDQVLFSEDVPLVIFDEFDSAFQDSRLGWLKFFLAPMEDGIFRGQTSNYKVGRALFLFAGGTASTFEEFAERDPLIKTEAERKESEQEIERKKAKQTELKNAKLPDFVSRLMAHLDVLGINRPVGTESETNRDITRRRVRRATLLRALLEEFAKPIIATDGKAQIDPHVIDAFLNDKVEYRNEARSMKAIIRGSLLIGSEFLQASLPPRGVIDLQTRGWKQGN
jgi:hypothetical protein